jgi:glycosyltransferase involved in cell wall biosynthesis
MKILHIVSGNLSGGAARGAYWLHLALVELGIDSSILTDSKVIPGDNLIKTIRPIKINRLKYFIKKNLYYLIYSLLYAKRNKIIFSSGLIGFSFLKTKEYEEADILHYHWINNDFINIKHLKKAKKPIIWTIRDMWPMTGGCHYSLGCNKYKVRCGECPQLKSKFNYDLSRLVLNRKKRYLPKEMKIVGISNWITDEAKSSYLFKDFDIRMFGNNINTDDFFPVDKEVSRKLLGIKTNKQIILVGANSLNSFYKGFDKFLEAIKFLNKDKYCLYFFGALDKEIADNIGFEYKSFGYLHDIISLRLVYSCADVFIAPSIMEAFGKTIAESMSCGTPVVCFDATGPRDIVDHKTNGYLAKHFESKDLAIGIEWVLKNKDYDSLCKNAREKVLREFDSKVVAKKYIDLYQEILFSKKRL